jgi:uncharacterized protein YjbI with pentapeptide repeats
MLRKLMSILGKVWKALAVVVFFALLIWGALQGYSFAWTGFGDYTNSNDELIRGKTLWDWMELFIIPIFLGVGAFLLNRSERNNEREIATDRQSEAALQSYIDRMADLLLNEKLRTTKNREVRDVARTRTLSVLRGLDGNRKGLLLRFLQEAKLIEKKKPVVVLRMAYLNDANLTNADLSGANLSGAYLNDAFLVLADLSDADLSGAYLGGADLLRAQLSGANLSGAYLNDTDLEDADLTNADLSDTDLSGANLNGADLSDANLCGANVTKKQLATVFSLKDARMPDGTKHE